MPLTFSLIQSLLRGRMLPQVVFQFTDHCQALCPQCGMRATEKFKRSRITVEQGKRLIDHAASQGVQFISFTGGEPLLFCDDLISLIEHAGQAGIPFIRTGTNGYLFRYNGQPDFEDKMHRLAEKLSQTKLYTFWISIDSAVAEVHENLRGMQGLFKGIEKALPVFHSHGIYPSVNLGINRMVGGTRLKYNPLHPETFKEDVRKSFSAFYSTVINLGFTMANACYPMSGEDSGENVYKATSTNDIVSFTRQEKALIFQTLGDVIPLFRSKIRIFTPRVALHALAREYRTGSISTYPCHGGIDFFFVDAAGRLSFPCGYRGEQSLGKFENLEIANCKDKPHCRQCDWECFRDPSELYGPLMDLVRRPARFAARVLGDRKTLGLWINDLRYMRACSYFNGRVEPDYTKLTKYSPADSQPVQNKTVTEKMNLSAVKESG